jgi:hypothetical protein
MAASPEIPPRVRQLATELAQPQPMRRGSVSERSIKCGKAGCACAHDPKARHGPYHSLTQAVGGKTRSRFLTAEQTAVAQQQVAAGRQFRQKVDSYWEACEEWADAQMELSPAAPSGEAKKKRSKQKSKTISSRKSKRS